jgi:hypothetical protein
MSTSFLNFFDLGTPEGKKMPAYAVENKSHERLGMVRFSGAWRKYTFHPESGMLFDSVCLLEIATFISSATAKWREGL